MKIVFSYVSPQNAKPRYISPHMVENALKLVKRHGYKTRIYLDQKSYNNFNKFGFDEIILLDQDKLDSLPMNVWCLGKLLTYLQIDEPFLHIDFDLFIINDGLKPFLDKPLVCFHEEKWVKTEGILKITKCYDFIRRRQLPLTINQLKHVYNCAVIGGTAIKEINESAQIVLDHVIEHKEDYNNKMIYLESIKKDWELPVFLEQILFINICKNKLNSISTILDGSDLLEVYNGMINKKMIHLWGVKQKVMENFEDLKNQMIKKLIYESSLD